MIRRVMPLRPVSPDDSGHYFFGYYDKCPWGRNSQHLLAHRATFIDRSPRPDDAVEIGYIESDTGSPRFHAIDRTSAWNWQQGAQLQWTPASGSGPQGLIFNQRTGQHVVTRMLGPNLEPLATLNLPIYTACRDGRWGLSLNYARLTAIRPEYGYAGLVDRHASDPAPKDDGVWRVELATGRSELLVSTAAVVAHHPNPMGRDAHHYLNHLMFNPSGDRFCFLHRFERPDGITQSRLFTLGIDGNDLRLLMEGMVSHYDWRDDHTLLAWAGKRKLLASGPGGGVRIAARRVLKPIYYALGKPRFLMNRIVGDSYLLIPDEEPSSILHFAKGELTCDGHCTYSSDRRWIVTDGYPDLNSRQPLFLWDVTGSQGYEIGRFLTPPHLDGPVRVDLHPRFNHDASAICVDSAMEGRRRMYVVDVAALTASDAARLGSQCA